MKSNRPNSPAGRWSDEQAAAIAVLAGRLISARSKPTLIWWRQRMEKKVDKNITSLFKLSQTNYMSYIPPLHLCTIFSLHVASFDSSRLTPTKKKERQRRKPSEFTQQKVRLKTRDTCTHLDAFWITYKNIVLFKIRPAMNTDRAANLRVGRKGMR